MSAGPATGATGRGGGGRARAPGREVMMPPQQEGMSKGDLVIATVTNVFRMGWGNPRLVSVVVDGVAARMRVKDRAAFSPGMQVRAKSIEPGLFEVAP